MTAPACSSDGRASRPWWEAGVVFVLLMTMVTLLGSSAREKSATYDEWSYIAGGLRFWKTGENAIHRDTPVGMKAWIAVPVRFLIDPALPRTSDDYPWNYGRTFLAQLDDPVQVLFLARTASTGLTVLLVLYVFLLARALWGRAGGLLALFAICFEPDVLAYGRLAHGDVALAAFGTGMVFFLWRAVAGRGRVNLVIAALHAVAATEAKFVGLSLVPLGLTVLVTGGIVGGRFRATWRQILFQVALFVAAFAVFLALVVWLVYGGFRVYLAGLASVSEHLERGHPTFFAGAFSDRGWWYYNLVSWLAKTPLAILLGVALVPFTFRNRASWQRFASVTVAAAGWVALSMTSSVCLGVRHMLVVTSLAVVVFGALARVRGRIEKRLACLWGRRVVVAVLLMWLATGTIRLFPDYLVHFNELAGGPAPEPPVLTDSNLDWGQDLPALAAWLAARGNPRVTLLYFGTDDPARFGIRTRPLPFDLDPSALPPGLLAVSVSYLVHAPRHPPLAGILSRCEPVTVVRGTVKVFRIVDRDPSPGSTDPGTIRDVAPLPNLQRNGEFR
jgi:hypothetical protein